MGHHGANRRHLNLYAEQLYVVLPSAGKNPMLTVPPPPSQLRKRTALNVVGQSLRRLVDGVSAENDNSLAQLRVHIPGLLDAVFLMVRSHYLRGIMASAIVDGDPFDTRTPRFVLDAILRLIVHRVQRAGCRR